MGLVGVGFLAVGRIEAHRGLHLAPELGFRHPFFIGWYYVVLWFQHFNAVHICVQGNFRS